jgi:hypothetical protein
MKTIRKPLRRFFPCGIFESGISFPPIALHTLGRRYPKHKRHFSAPNNQLGSSDEFIGLSGTPLHLIQLPLSYVCLTNQENAGNDTRYKQQAGEHRYSSVDSKLTKAMASLLLLVLPLLSFYCVKTSIDNIDGFKGWRFAFGIVVFLAHLFGSW